MGKQHVHLNVISYSNMLDYILENIKEITKRPIDIMPKRIIYRSHMTNHIEGFYIHIVKFRDNVIKPITSRKRTFI